MIDLHETDYLAERIEMVPLYNIALASALQCKLA